jgi:DNA-binding transcriptional ArsR family regulator
MSTYDELKSKFENNDIVCEKVINTLSLISNKIRFRILCLLSKGEFCVNDIVDIINCGKPSNISQQLKILRLAGVIGNRRDKQQLIYFILDHKISELIAYLEEKYL